MKYKDGNFLQLNRDIFKYRISYQAKWLYTVLTELEHKFTFGDGKKDWFYRSGPDLETDTGLTAKTIRKYRQELESVGLTKTWKHHLTIPDSSGKAKKSKDYVIAFKILH